MKNTIISISILSLISITSCKKDYTCECKAIETESGVTNETVIGTYSSSEKMTKLSALNWCKEYGGLSETGPDYEYKEECDIK